MWSMLESGIAEKWYSNLVYQEGTLTASSMSVCENEDLQILCLCVSTPWRGILLLHSIFQRGIYFLGLLFF